MIHKVARGEHLARIARKYGFADFGVIWEHSGNAGLKQARKNPHVLAPGDELLIPDRERRIEKVVTGKQHTFCLKAAKLKLRLRLLDLGGLPLAAVPVTLEVNGDARDLVTDGDGFLEQEIPASATRGVLTVLDLKYDLEIGALDPVDTRPGLQARLNNLGYFTGEVDYDADAEGAAAKTEASPALEGEQDREGEEKPDPDVIAADDDDAELLFAVACFARDNKMGVATQVSSEIRGQLEKLHGC